MYSPGQLMALRAGGDQFPIEAAISQVNVGGQKVFTVILRDISERKRAEANLQLLYEAERQARQEAEKSDRLKLQFLAMISHELRTPLASIKGFVTTLLADDVTFDASQQRQFLNVIDEEADRLHGLIEQLLDLSRLQAGTLSIVPVPVELSAILADAAPQLEILTRKHILQTDIPERIPSLRVDRRRVVQVLVNLVDNAVTYSPVGTEICVSAHQQGDFVRVAVADQGPGIPQEERQHVFEAFQQLAHSSKGAGLGLAICKGLVEAHSGTWRPTDLD
jgi:two-component system sensor histidine kinase KdpD